MGRFVWRLARRPEDIVEAMRWLFAVLVLVTLGVTLPSRLAMVDSSLLAVGLVSATVLAFSWSVGYLRRSAPLWMDVVDSLAFLGFSLTGPDPMVILGLIMPSLWFRSLYGSARRATIRACFYAGTLVAAAQLWVYVPGDRPSPELGAMLGSIPAMFLTVIASRQIYGGLRARAQATQRDAVHMSLGSELLGLTDPGEIRRIAWIAMAGICAATPGLRVLKVVRDGPALRVDGATGGFTGLPATFPAHILSLKGGEGGGGSQTVQSSVELNAASGAECVWACLTLPGEHAQHGYSWLLLGSPRKVSREALVAVGTLANQMTLALHNGEVHEKLTLLAELDGLTGLANRASFKTALLTALDDTSAQNTTVLFVDLDDFKDVNDQLGHGAGDEVLRVVAARLGRATRPGDLIARLGGDEFAVLLHETDGEVAADVARRIVAAVGATMRIGGAVARVGASIGVATATSETDLEQLIHHADVAMYAAKAKGKGRIQPFEPGLLQVDSSEVTLERQLAQAAENGELVVHYQPILSLVDGRCTAVEALVRWQHPKRGLLYPDSFIEAAERTGAISDIGAYVLRRACADTATWQDAHPGAGLSIHVNISAIQLDDEGFVDVVMGCLSEFSIVPGRLVLEVTETIVISSPVAIKRLNTLAELGVTIAIDDFGTGYSALTTLRSLPAQVVKIDKSFVAGCPENAQDRAVVEAVVQMAAQMGMRTIAEGVERPEQRAFLEGVDADAVQGFLYLRPTIAREFGTWLATHLAGLPQSRDASDVVIPFQPRASRKTPSPPRDLPASTTGHVRQ